VDRCNICGAARERDSESTRVRSNVRRFRDEDFEVWRCAACRSIHAAEPVDLAHYYAGYPIFAAALDWKLYVVYGSLLKRLRRAGLAHDQRILDYGCGSGLLVRFLNEQGYAGAVGYDEYAAGFHDAQRLAQRYDCVVCQDVIEHVDDPLALLSSFDSMLEPGGLISVGTPDAAALDLQRAEDYVHALHLPYHRHILSLAALVRAGQKLGWSLVRSYDTMYNNTLFPTMNPRFVLHYVRAHDDVFDLVAEPPRANLKLMTPASVFFALFGYFFDRHTDIQVIFRKAGA
jgi:2-polyprenyl-3-methyl-5-hydroxy-6-metoxy-1,4-benzoquinol methylase